MNIKNLTTPSTADWGKAMHDFVRLFIPIAVIAVTVYSLGVDVYRKPSIITDWMLQKHTTSDSTLTTFDTTPVVDSIDLWEQETVTAPEPVSPLLEIPIEKEHEQVLAYEPVSRDIEGRKTRRRSSMDLIRSLSA